MRLFDSHSHIDDTCYETDFEEMLQRAEKAEVKAVMVVGIDLKRTLKAIELAEHHAHIFASIGVHPHDAKFCTEEIIGELRRRATHEKVKAWGETGLDFNRMHSPAKIQEKCFLEQIEAADQCDLPMIFHERDSEGRFLEILSSMNHRERNGVVHCFSGTRKELFTYLDLGYHIGITGIITIKERGAFLREITPLIPEDRILIETDAPYLTPAPMKNKTRRNEPAFVRAVLMKIAEVKEMDAELLAETVWENTCRLYNIHF